MSEAIDRARARWASELGTGSRRALERAYASAVQRLSMLDEPAAARLIAALEHAHAARHGQAALRAELADERERDAAAIDDAVLVRYERTWSERLARLQRRHAQRWFVPGLSEVEVRDALTLRLIEAIRGGSEARDAYCRAGKPWGLVVAEHELRALRRAFRLAATVLDLRELPLPERAPSQEERWLEQEADACRGLAEQRARVLLNRAQRRWLDAMTSVASAGGCFESNDRLNLSAVSRVLGRHRSSAQRAYRELETAFRRELERVE